MKKITFVLIMALTLGGLTTKAQVWSENFNGGIPSTWTEYNDANSPDATYFNATFVAKWKVSSWATINLGGGDSALVTVSRFSPAATADRWLVSPKFKVTDVHTFLTFHYFDYYPGYGTDSLEVWVSPTGDVKKSSFTKLIYNDASGTDLTATHAAPLGAYNGSTIRVAFVNRNTQGYITYLDNIGTVIPTNSKDMALLNTYPTVGHPLCYNTVGNSIYISGYVQNLGYDSVSSFVVKYQQGTNTPVSQTFTTSLGLDDKYYFNLTGYSIPKVGDLPMKIWVEQTGDLDHSNDTVAADFHGVGSFPKKRIVFEEGTGTWCGWCVRGIVFMDSLYATNSSDAAFIAVHNNSSYDPMVVASYDSLQLYAATAPITGFPSVRIDRREVTDPQNIIYYFNQEKNYFGFADINCSGASLSSGVFIVTANVTPSVDLSGDYRLALIMTEDKVHGSGGNWPQHNYYSKTSQNRPLVGQGVNYQNEANPIPASKMFYKFVARDAVPSVNGAAGSLPSSMTSGTKYSYNFSETISTSWNPSHMRAYVLLIRSSDGVVLNSAEVNVNVGIKDVAAGVNSLRLYPNPATDEALLNVDLTKTTNASVIVTDITGKVVFQNAVSQLAAGEYYYRIPTADLANGIYIANFQTETGSVTTKFVVSH